MIHRLHGLVLTGALAAALAACDGGGGLSIPEVFDSIASSTCAKAFDCQDSFPGTAQQFTDAFGASEAACVDIVLEDAETDLYEASVDAGRIVYDADDAQACLDSQDLGSVSCDDLWAGNLPEPAPECETTFVGTVPDGEQCTMSDDCAGDASSCIDGVCSPG
jgi:hypothetical protein